MASTTTTTTIKVASRDLLRIADLDSGELTDLLDLAQAMKADPTGWLDSHPGEILRATSPSAPRTPGCPSRALPSGWGCCP